jgi:hypothetical protein
MSDYQHSNLLFWLTISLRFVITSGESIVTAAPNDTTACIHVLYNSSFIRGSFPVRAVDSTLPSSAKVKKVCHLGQDRDTFNRNIYVDITKQLALHTVVHYFTAHQIYTET